MKLTDEIERFILSLLDEEQSQVELQRCELAKHFSCAPSQINYVLATRFSPDRGYIIESRRGGGGYIRVTRVNIEGVEYISYLLHEGIGDMLSQDDARQIVLNLLEQGIIKEEQAQLMVAATSDSAFAPFGGKPTLRAGVLKSMLLCILDTIH